MTLLAQIKIINAITYSKYLITLANMLEKENYKQIPVSDIYCNMTAVKKVISPHLNLLYHCV